MRETKELRDVLNFDKKFKGLQQRAIDKVLSFSHVSAETMKEMKIEGGDVRLLSVGQFEGFTTKDIASDNLCYGEVITIPTGGAANFKYHNGYFVDSGNILCSPKNVSINGKYVYYFLCKNVDLVDSMFQGAGIRHPKMSEICKIRIPICSYEEQCRIVAELELLTEIIDKQKQQLKELDTLAQSIFYDMFGNLTDNNKGWRIDRLEENCEVSSAKRVLVEDVVDSGVPFIRGTELTALNRATSSKDVQFTMFITPEHYEKLKAITGVPKQGDILIPSINSEGISWVVDTEMPFYFKDGRVIWVHVNLDVFASEYLKNAISTILKANYETLTSGATFLELKLFIIRDLMIPIPPLELQREFAMKLQCINQQKRSINRSLAESQKLFDYTMDKYFG